MENTNYEFGAVPPDLLRYVKDKRVSSKYWFEYLLIRTKMMFQYKGLPKTIDPAVLERYLQVNGICAVTEVDGNLYCFNGSAGGKQDVYYRPTLFVVANPHFKDTFSKDVVVGEVGTDFNEPPLGSQPGVLMRNDSEWIGLSPLIAKYSVMLAENLLTIRSADVMLRIIALITASSDKSYKSAMAYLNKLEKGEFGAISDDSFSENQINMQSPPSNNGSYLTQFIELHQYLLGSFFNELGLRANYNMKREAIGQGESSMDEDAIMPLCDDMLLRRKEDVAKINEMYGTSISVDFSSAWLSNKIERNLMLVSQLSESGAGEVGSTADDSGQVGSGPETKGENEENGGDDNNDNNSEGTGSDETGSGERGTEDVESEDSGSDGEGEDTQGEDRNNGEAGENGQGENTDSEGETSDDGRPEVNDITPNPFLDELNNFVENLQPKEKTEPDVSQLMGGDQNGLLGGSESSGNEDNNSDS